MHAAPPVRMAIEAERGWRLLTACCAGVAGGNLVAWGAQWAELTQSGTVGVAILAAAGCASVAWRANSPEGLLCWDAGSWHWVGRGEAPCQGGVHVMLDMGVWMLLCFKPGTQALRARWLPVSRRRAGAEWTAWRAALYAQRTPQAATPPA